MNKVAILLIFSVLCFVSEAFIFKTDKLGMPQSQGPNPINPNFTYVEVNKVDKVAMNLPYPGEFYTGYITVNQTSGSKIFYQLYSAGGNLRNSTVNDSAPLILSLAGGPGCPGGNSYYEHGPFRVIINDTFQPILNEVTWNDNYHLLYLDNPVGVGYSVENNDMPAYASQNGIYLVNFLTRFFELYPSLKDQPFYAQGESYGGHMVLGLATQILQNPQLGIKLTGIGFQDGWFDPYYQISTWSNGLYSAGLLDSNTRDTMSGLLKQFQQAVKAENYSLAWSFVNPVENLVNAGFDPSEVFNNTDWDATTLIWLSLPTTKQLLAADPNTVWTCINLKSIYYLDFVQSYAPNVTWILNNYNISFLFYQGQEDFLVPAAGTQTSLLHLGWKNITKYEASPNNIWTDPDGKVIGQFRHYDKLTYATVNKCGHNCAHDQPWSAKNLIDRWINNKW